ncbi:hypothetical protein FAZ19_22480 [Sphingobacterium alkalisoli]|uniref:Uncharacterized protein n=1 Tax=Sphingobacterium alkalisoli TaxID=1874115 RepID=A0A4U0GPL5_9SPHI|nr:hypothetical protein [Sphingobacterium alkalisoli]TJY60707.1 hypothetical protein FAZ19_22480 [Sphingobacterium alkalisoli]GGH31465.1 hypothetical protein GCM10011418_44290 [Sphingobacterium alkalisoli]
MFVDPDGQGIFLLEKAKSQGVLQGIEKGVEKGKQDAVENLITELSLTDDTIARIAEVSLEFAKKVRKDLDNSKK